MGLVAKANVISIGHSRWTSTQLDLIKRTVAKDCNDDEFNQYLHTAGHLELDPLRRQIYAFVFNKDDAKKRNMSIIIGIGGFRAVADRTCTYRPDDALPVYTYDEAAKNPATNPTGLVKCEVKVWKYVQGSWWPVPNECTWDAYAPIVEEWGDDEQTGRRKPTGKFTLDKGKKRWLTDPRGMLAKCAEAGALRKGWPDRFSNVYAQEEIDRSETLDLRPSEYAEMGAVERRMEKIGGKGSILFDWFNGEGMVPTPIGKIADKVAAFLKEHPEDAETFAGVNKYPLREFWAMAPTDALETKKLLEGKAKP